MYLEYDFYLCKYALKLPDDSSLYQLLSNKFDLDILPSKGSYMSFNLTFLAYLCHYVALPETAALLGPVFGSPATCTKWNRLVKAGVLNSSHFPQQDGNCRVAFCLTKSGSEIILSKLPDDVQHRVKIRRSGNKVTLHDYSLGLSILHLLLSPFHFLYQKEYFISTGHMKEKASLCVDACISVKKPYPFLLYLEQDMGTEPTPVLIGKLYEYDRKGLTQSLEDALIISCHMVTPNLDCPSFTLRHLKSILHKMQASGLESIWAFYSTYAEILTIKELASLRSLLIRTQVCSGYDASGRPLPAERLKPDSRLRRNNDMPDLTSHELQRYVNDLIHQCNPYRLREYNKRQHRNAAGRFRSIIRSYIDPMSKHQFGRHGLLCLIQGFRCFVVPTALLSNYLPHAAPYYYQMPELYTQSIEHYFPGFDSTSFRSFTDIITLQPDHPGIVLRNAFTYRNGIIAFENISNDVGGFLRCMYLNLFRTINYNRNIQVICICENESDAVYFCNILNFFYNSQHMQYEGIHFYFLLTSEIGHYGQLRSMSSLTDLPQLFKMPLPDTFLSEKEDYIHDFHVKRTTENGTLSPLPDSNTISSNDLEQLSLSELFCASFH